MLYNIFICDTVQAPDCAILKFEIREFYICKSCPHSHMIIVHCVKSGIWMFPPRIVVHAIDQSISGWLPKDADVGHSPTGAGSALSYSVHRCASWEQTCSRISCFSVSLDSAWLPRLIITSQSVTMTEGCFNVHRRLPIGRSVLQGRYKLWSLENEEKTQVHRILWAFMDLCINTNMIFFASNNVFIDLLICCNMLEYERQKCTNTIKCFITETLTHWRWKWLEMHWTPNQVPQLPRMSRRKWVGKPNNYSTPSFLHLVPQPGPYLPSMGNRSWTL